MNTQSPLNVDEVLACFRYRWGVSYDMKLLVKRDKLFLQIMWGYLEQKSFPLNEDAYRQNLNDVLEIVNRLGQADVVREWIFSVQSKPRIGRALSLQLKADERLAEFLL